MKLILPKTMDPRFSALAEKGTEEGFSVVEYTDSLPCEKGIVFFPFAADEKTLCDALACLPAESLVFVGKATESVKKKAKAKGMALTSLLEDPTYLLQNAVHTAEGTLAEVIFHTKRRLDELCILVYGYGNCGSAIARRGTPARARPRSMRRDAPVARRDSSTRPRPAAAAKCNEVTWRIPWSGSLGSRSRGSGRDTPFPSRCAWRSPSPAPSCPRRSRRQA